MTVTLRPRFGDLVSTHPMAQTQGIFSRLEGRAGETSVIVLRDGNEQRVSTDLLRVHGSALKKKHRLPERAAL